MEKRNLTSGFIWLGVFAVYCLLTILTLPEKIRTYPYLLSAVGAALSVMLIVKHYRRIKKGIGDEKKAPAKLESKENMTRIVLLVVLTLAYVLLLNVTGFLVTSILFMFALIHTMSRNKNLLLEIIVSVLFPTVIYLVFVVAFKVSLPSGFLL